MKTESQARVNGSKSATASQSDIEGGTYPTCEPVLEDQASGLSAEERRQLARVYERWAMQLFASADLFDKLTSGQPNNTEIVFPEASVQEFMQGLTRSQCLEVVSKFLDWSSQIYNTLGVKKTLGLCDKSERSLFLQRN